MGELAGGRSSTGSASQTSTAQLTLVLDGASVPAGGNLVGALAGSGQDTFSFKLSVTSDSAGSGFFGGIIVGDPPSAAPTLLAGR